MRQRGIDIFNASIEHSEKFILVFYSNWLQIRKFYLNLWSITDRSIKIGLSVIFNLIPTLEDTANQPSVANASLYNGQPKDTGSSCPSAGLASCTPSIHNIKDGESVENVPTGNKQWFVLRVSYGRIVKAKSFVEAKGLECYVPLRYKEIKQQGKRRIITEPLLPSFLFVRATAEQTASLLLDVKAISNNCRALLSYYYNHTAFRQDNPCLNPPLTIRDESMNNFIRLTSIKNPHIIPVTSEHIQFKLGDHVVVTDGEFRGVHGRVARIAGQQRVIVELFDDCLVATAYVPKEAMNLKNKL